MNTELASEPPPTLRFGLAHLFALTTQLAIILAGCQRWELGSGLCFAIAIASLAVIASRWTMPARYSLLATYAIAGALCAGVWLALAWLFASTVGRSLADFWIDAATTLACGACFGLVMGMVCECILTLWAAADAPFANGSVESRCPPEHRWLRLFLVGVFLLSTIWLGRSTLYHWGLPALMDWVHERGLVGDEPTPLQEFTARRFDVSGSDAMNNFPRRLLVAAGVYEHVAFEFDESSAYSGDGGRIATTIIHSELLNRPATFGMPYAARNHATIEIWDTPERIEKWRAFVAALGGKPRKPVNR